MVLDLIEGGKILDIAEERRKKKEAVRPRVGDRRKGMRTKRGRRKNLTFSEF
ncbi:MAG: hypothetical protein F6K24_22545 [Okeania sp. SIO2D1]|nr:hypothetical protein [Okeania sp. SIO2D1]